MILILFLGSPFVCIPVQASPDSTQNSPTSYEDNAWTNPTYAYVSDNQRASEGSTLDKCTYKNYGFLDDIPENSTIDTVVLQAEGYVSSTGSQKVYGEVSWDGGSTWSTQTSFSFQVTESMHEIDVTGATSWTRDKLSDANFRSRIMYWALTGCYRDNNYLVGKDEKGKWTIKTPSQIKVGDRLLVWNEEEGMHYSPVEEVKTHEGRWMLFDFWSGKTTLPALTSAYVDVEWNSHMELTGEHPLLILAWDQVNGSWFDSWETMDAEEVYKRFIEKKDLKDVRYDQISHLNYGTTLLLEDIWKVEVSPFKGIVYDVVVEEKHVYKFSKTLTDDEMDFLNSIGYTLKKQVELKPPFLIKAGKDTGYVDWLPVEVDYTPPEAEEEEWVDCQHIGVNNTLAGDPTLFSTDWTDINASEGLSHFLFSTNNTGTWQNETWTDSWRNVVWADATKTLNSSEVTVAFRFYINNTEGTEYASTICYFPTYIPEESEAEPTTDDGVGAGGYYEPQGNILVDGFMMHIAFPILNLWVYRNLNVKGIFWTIMLSVCIVGLVQQIFRHPTKQKVQVNQE